MSRITHYDSPKPLSQKTMPAPDVASAAKIASLILRGRNSSRHVSIFRSFSSASATSRLLCNHLV